MRTVDEFEKEIMNHIKKIPIFDHFKKVAFEKKGSLKTFKVKHMENYTPTDKNRVILLTTSYLLNMSICIKNLLYLP